METTLSHYGNWWAVLIWILLFGVFLAFIPFYRKSQRRPESAYMAFLIIITLEMFGIPVRPFPKEYFSRGVIYGKDNWK